MKDVTRFNRPAPGQPGLHCQWTPCPEGCCLSWDGTEKFYEPTAWLGYLIEHFLRPGAVVAAQRPLDDEGFTFDHVVNGIVVACRRDTRRLWMICVDDNVVSETDLEAGLDERKVWGPFPYEEQIDARRERRRRRRDIGSFGAVVRPANGV